MNENEITRQEAAAKKIFELIPVWDRTGNDADMINDIFNNISVNPIETIEYLLNIIDELNA